MPPTQAWFLVEYSNILLSDSVYDIVMYNTEGDEVLILLVTFTAYILPGVHLFGNITTGPKTTSTVVLLLSLLEYKTPQSWDHCHERPPFQTDHTFSAGSIFQYR